MLRRRVWKIFAAELRLLPEQVAASVVRSHSLSLRRE
jgi:hypothetical protein